MSIISADEAIILAAKGEAVFVDTRAAAAWAEATIPGAVNLNVYDYFIPESSEEGIRGMVAGARAAFEKLGLDRAAQVIFFEDRTGMVSPRGAWFFELCGFQGGRILDGGWQAWRAAGGDAATGHGASETIIHGDPALAGEFRRDLVASTQDVLESGAHILDARRPAEWDGSYVHACCARAGRIEGADLLFYEDVLEDGHYRSAQEIRQIAEGAGFQPDQRIIAYCHRGARAATALYGLRIAGYDKVSVYTGSWHEWASNADLPTIEGSGAHVHR